MDAPKPILLNPKDDNSEFRCDICNKYLSIPPILFSDTVGNVCGRCFDDKEITKFNNEIFQVQKVYENIAKYIMFPCSYYINGCKKELNWSEVRKHEELCDFKDATCPLSCQEFIGSFENTVGIFCEWKGTSQDLVSHLKNSHDDCISSTNQLILLPTREDSDKILLSEVSGIFTVIVLYYLKNFKRYYCNVLMDFSFKDSKNYQYELEIFDTTEKKSVIFPGNNVEPINGRDLTKKSIKTSLEIDPNIIRELLRKSSSMILCFKIMKVYEDKTVPLDIGEKGEPDEEICIINDLKCSCGNLLFAPVYICQKGHNGCDKCYYGYCKKCSSAFTSKTNTTLETVTFLTKYPCKNKTKGCSYTIDFNKLAIHEENCIFTEKDCLLKCGWKGINTDMFKHIRSEHPPLQLNQKNTYDTQLKSKCYPILFDNKIFMFTIEYTMSYPLYIQMQCLGIDEWTYEFEFTILSSCDSIHCVSTHLCQPLSFGDDKKVISTQKIQYPYDFFTQFITDHDNIHFKINISKIHN